MLQEILEQKVAGIQTYSWTGYVWCAFPIKIWFSVWQ